MRLPQNQHELTRAEIMEEWWKVIYHTMKYKDGKYFSDNLTVYENDCIQTYSLQPNNSPIKLSVSMF
jgi:hypothetical protein